MGKRSDFKRRARDRYDTPREAVLPLLRHLAPHTRFCEPCAGRGHLIKHLEAAGHVCVEAWEFYPRGKPSRPMFAYDARRERLQRRGIYITNPMWSRDVLHPIIQNLGQHRPTWLIFDGDWLHTRQANGLWQSCSKIVSVGRVKWIKNSPHVGKDNACWYLFSPGHTSGPQFIGRS